MNCDEAEILLHALIDGELDAGHAREVEDHVAGCPRCAAQLQRLSRDEQGDRRGRSALHGAARTAPADRGRAAAAGCTRRAGARCCAALRWARRYRRSPRPVWSRSCCATTTRQRIQSEVVSAHLRSLQAGHLTDVISTDQHTVKPWFNGKLDVAPPVIDLTAQGFTLIGGRLDYVDARADRRRRLPAARARDQSVRRADRQHRAPRGEDPKRLQGFNIRRWSDRGLNYWAVSDLGADELAEFGEKFETRCGATRRGRRAKAFDDSHQASGYGSALRRTRAIVYRADQSMLRRSHPHDAPFSTRRFARTDPSAYPMMPCDQRRPLLRTPVPLSAEMASGVS